MAAIDIGSAATSREGTCGLPGYTLIDKTNPANDSGTITTIEIWAYNELANCEVATFYEGASNVFTTRDTEALGTVTAGEHSVSNGNGITVSLDVQTGDVIGYYSTSGEIKADYSGGTGNLYLSGDNIPCSGATFTAYDVYPISLYGIGATAGGIKWNTKTISKFNTATISKWNGI